MKFSLRTRVSVGLDIGSDSIKYVKLERRGESYDLLSCGLVPILTSKEASREETLRATAEALRELLKHESRFTEIFTCVNQVSPFSSTGVVIRSISLPPMSRSELDKAIVWAAKKNVPVSLDETYFDYQVPEGPPDRQTGKKEITIVAGTKGMVDDRVSVCEKAGLTVSGISVTPFALAGLSKSGDVSLSSSLVIDIGSKSTTIAIFQNGYLMLSREILTAGDSITEAIVEAGLVSHEEAEDLKLRMDLTKQHERPEVMEGVTSALDRIISEIERSFSFHQKKYPDAPISDVYLTGGTACLKGLSQLVEDALGIKVRIINPFERMDIRTGAGKSFDLDRFAPAFCLATGLALGRDEGINLLPPEIKERRQISKLKRVLGVGAMGFLAGILLIDLFIGNEAKRAKNMLVLARAGESRIPAPDLSDTVYSQEKEEHCRAMMATLSGLRGNQTITPSLVREIANVAPPSLMLKKIALGASEDDEAEPEADGKEAPEKAAANKAEKTEEKEAEKTENESKAVPGVEIKGLVCEKEIPEAVLAKFLIDLSSSAQLHNLKVLSQKNNTVLGRKVLEFELSCELK
ncbi:MAG: type IV pilus assembly protein PilM [Pseudomonadota bacterium]